jgi:hypothetical protein
MSGILVIMNDGNHGDDTTIEPLQKPQEFEQRLNVYMEVKERRRKDGSSSSAINMETLLSHDTTSIDLIDKQILSYLFGDWYKNLIYIEGDLSLKTLDLDKLGEVCDGLVVNGNLTVEGGIYNLEGDYGPALVVSGNVLADCLICGGSEICLHGDTQIYGFIVAHYNHGMLLVIKTKALVGINNGHFFDVRGDVLYRFSDDGSKDLYDLTYLAKIYTKERLFVEIDEYEDDDDDYYLDIDAFNREIAKNDIALLEEIKRHFYEYEMLKQRLDEATCSGDTQLAEKLKGQLANYTDSDNELDSCRDSNCLDDDMEDVIEDSAPGLDFKFYTLSELEDLNNEIEKGGYFVVSIWKNIIRLLNREKMSALGLVIAKINKILESSNFNGIVIKDKAHSLKELDKFERTLEDFYFLQQKMNLLMLGLFSSLMWFYPDSVILYILVAFELFSLIKKHVNLSKHKKWVLSARVYVNKAPYSANGDNRNESDELDDVLTFLKYTTEQEKKGWSVQLFDWVVNVVKGKKR